MPFHTTRFVLLLALAFPALALAQTLKPLIIAHRGASGYMPEHTLEAYRLAMVMGADYIEPDLVSTKDGVLIARHENELSETTDVAEKFPARKAKKKIDGRDVQGWFSEDFTLAEIKTLRAKERLATRNQSNNGKYEIPTFAEVLAVANEVTTARGQAAGVYPETKHPSYFASIGLALEPLLLKDLKAVGRDKANSRVFIQSFEVSNLKQLKTMTPVPLVQLLGPATEKPYDQELAGKPLTYGSMASDQGLAEIATYAAGVGPVKNYIISINRAGKASAPTDFVERAHKVKLQVHPYTFRSDEPFLAVEYEGEAVKEYCAFLALGIDGFFTDFADTALKARDKSCPMSPAP